VAGAAQSLVVAQVGLSCVLIVAAGLFVRSLDSLVDVPLGFEPSNLIVVDVTTGPSTTVVPRMPLYERARRAVHGLPGVSDATLSVSAPMTGWDLLVEVEAGHASTSRPGGAVNDSLANIVSPGWFRALGTPLVAGRDFTVEDGPEAAAVVVVNEAFARQFLGGGLPLGRTIVIRGMGPHTPPRTIVGIAGDALWSLRDPVPPILYVPLAQADQEALELRVKEQGLTLGIRARRGATTALTTRIVEAVGHVDPGLTLTFRSPAAHITASLTQERITAVLSGFFGVLALALAAVALYGVTGYAVSCRRAEIGIRLALGGTPMAVARLVLGPLWRLVGIGVTAGALASVVLAPLVSGLLYGIGPRDALTLSAATFLLAAVAALAAWIPAYRASSINPIAVLRAE
jgi:putative ABC transport system permease protein